MRRIFGALLIRAVVMSFVFGAQAQNGSVGVGRLFGEDAL
jgi:hypothetical protein